jgi:UDP-N-acetylglucosamine--N-acetylmuramyl-(pentapeptide) pyrophosphoryl-undecaprenol N-acetylglucosamine transferase
MSEHLIVMAGGTGGHIYPGLAIARAMRSRGWEVSWMGTHGGMEQTIVNQSEFALKAVEFEGIVGRGLGSKLRLPLKLWTATRDAKRHFAQRHPTAVIGMGGYPTVPGGLAAWRAGVPLVIHQGDAVAGAANRLLSRVAALVLTGFASTFNNLGAKRVVTGNPIRREFSEQDSVTSRFASRVGALRIVVMGGSRGAEALNKTLPEALATLPADQRPQVLHQTGAGAVDATVARYKACGVEADVFEFLDKAWIALAGADLFIGRSGASTVSELAALGVASILIPYPHHADQQQLHNAKVLADVGAAKILEQKDLTPNSLAALIVGLDRATLQRMADHATTVAKLDATDRICDAIVAAVAKNNVVRA